MRKQSSCVATAAGALLFASFVLAGAAPNHDSVCAPCIQAHEDFLASDAMGGRGSGTRDELVAAEYIASELQQYGLHPLAGGNGAADAGALGAFIQPAEAHNRKGEAVHTRNVLAVLPGSDPKLKDQVILLSAHMDHLGTLPARAVHGDAIFNGADDDASGVVAVLELARVLALGPPPRRTVVFALWGSEELGMLGARYFLAHPTFPLGRIAANLEFEMIGRPDPKIAANALWLTGYPLNDLGPALAAHGARLVADPHPEQHFFRRSDNYRLACKGIIAQTVSSFGLHPQYHQPDDDIAHIDFTHMTAAIGAMIAPVRWLADSDFTPRWNSGRLPAACNPQPAR